MIYWPAPRPIVVDDSTPDLNRACRLEHIDVQLRLYRKAFERLPEADYQAVMAQCEQRASMMREMAESAYQRDSWLLRQENKHDRS